MRVTRGRTYITSELTVDADIDMDSHKLTDMSAGSEAGHSLRREQVVGVFLPLAGGTMTGDITLAARKLKTTDLLLKQHTSDYMSIRTVADDGAKGLRVDYIHASAGVKMIGDGAIIATPDVDNTYARMQARDNTAGLVEIARLEGAAEPRFQHTLPLNLGPDVELTIAGGIIVVGQAAGAAFYRVDTEADAVSDDLDTINGGVEGDIVVFINENTAHTVNFKHGTGNIQVEDGADFALADAKDFVICLFDGTNWRLKKSA